MSNIEQLFVFSAYGNSKIGVWKTIVFMVGSEYAEIKASRMRAIGATVRIIPA